MSGGNRPDVILVPASYDGRDIAGRLSVRLDAPVITNVVSLAAEGDDVRSQHGLFGGAQIATARLHRRAAVDLRGAGQVLHGRARRRGRARRSRAVAGARAWRRPNGAKVLARHAEERTGPKLDEAEVVVSGGPRAWVAPSTTP